MRTFFVTGIGTDVGKTICAAILVEALKADYWKPIQAGELENTDSEKVKNLISNSISKFHQEQYLLKSAMSPHAASQREGIEINLDDFKIPETKNLLVIEGAGGLMVPINSTGDLMIDLMVDLDPEIILVSQNYLGSINHTLLSIEALRHRGLKIKGIIFNGIANPETEEIILKNSGIKCLGKIPQTEKVDCDFILEQAKLFEKL